MPLRRLIPMLAIGLAGWAGCTSSGRTDIAGDPTTNHQEVPSDAAPATPLIPTECDGRTVEVLEEVWPDEKPKVREEVVKDDEGNYVRHGTTTHWHENGPRKLEIEYVCGMKHGSKRTWYSDGKPWSVGGFLEGREHGTWATWNHGGTKDREFNMNRGAWHGPFRTWYENGQLKIEVEFVDGIRQGPMTVWDERGDVLRVIVYVDGEEQPSPDS